VTVDGATDAVRAFDGASFALVSPVVSGRVRATISSLEWEPVSFEVDVSAAGGVVDVGGVRLAERKTLRLKLVSPAGAPAVDVAVGDLVASGGRRRTHRDERRPGRGRCPSQAG
jgi:hypothetical protein